MNQRNNVAAALLILFTSGMLQGKERALSGEERKAPMLVSTAWLQDHLHDPSVIIFHVAQRRQEYKYGHIPGARFLWTSSLDYTNPDLTLELPQLAQADSVLKNLGVSDGVRIILYFEGNVVTPTTRIYFTFDYLGLGNRVSLLDGGLDAWKMEGRPVTMDFPEIPKGSVGVKLNPHVVADCDEVKNDLDNPKVSIIDARGPQFYAGNGGGMPRAGHIPGAINIPFSSLVDSTNKLKDEASLRKIFDDAGVKHGNTIVAYCHIGQQASLVYFVAKYLGYDVKLYDGSYEEWSGRKDLPIVNPSVAAAKK
jgi:thiosulfate/3-mercaptopyruvate sulfurtransferase